MKKNLDDTVDIFEKYGLDRSDKPRLKLILAKWELAKLLGGKCAKCGETDLRVLCFHHKLGGMGSDRWRCMSREQRYAQIREIIEAGRPEDIEILCMNCHTKDFSRPKLGDRFSEFLADFKLRKMMIRKRMMPTELPDGLKLIE
jgi:hypothetical protein